MAIRLLQEHTFVILTTLVGALAAGWLGAIIMGVVGLVLDNTINPHHS